MPHSIDPIARLDGVVKRYGRLVALDGVRLQLRCGELLALLGPDGAGKSSAIGLLFGALMAKSPTALTARRLRRHG